MKALNTLDELFWEQLRDIYSAENQLIKALPKVGTGSNYEDLEIAILAHLEETRLHVERLDRIFETYSMNPKGPKCKAMEGLVLECSEMIEHDGMPAILDAGIVCCAQKIEHYEIATYGTLLNWAHMLNYKDAAELLERTLQEEKKADRILTEISEVIIDHAATEDEGPESNDNEIENADDAESVDAEPVETEENVAAAIPPTAIVPSHKEQIHQMQADQNGQNPRFSNTPSRNEKIDKKQTVRDAEFSHPGHYPARNEPSKQAETPRHERNRPSHSKSH